MIAIWRLWIAKLLLAIRLDLIAKCMLAIWQHPIAKHTLAIVATSYCLNRNNRDSSFYKTRRSKLCYLTCFSYFSHYFLILVFSWNCSSLISLRLSWLHRNLISRPVFFVPLALQASTLYMRPHISGTERMGFSKQDTCGNLVVPSLPVISPFRLLPKVSHANVYWSECK